MFNKHNKTNQDSLRQVVYAKILLVFSFDS